MATCDPGDEVIVPEPCFVAYQPTVIFAGGVPVAVPTYVDQDFQVTVDDLEKARTPRTKAVLLGYPNNPTGAVLERSRLAEIAEWAAGTICWSSPTKSTTAWSTASSIHASPRCRHVGAHDLCSAASPSPTQ